MNVKMVVVISGTILILVGVSLIVIQFYLQSTTPELSMPTRSLDFEALGIKTEVSTTYVGLALVVVGALLEAVGLAVKQSDNEK